MKRKLVRYKAKPEAVAENRRLIEAVFEQLEAMAPESVSYMVIELGDGSFVHLKSDAYDGAFELGEREAIQAVKTAKERWCEADISRVAGEIALILPGRDAVKAEEYF